MTAQYALNDTVSFKTDTNPLYEGTIRRIIEHSGKITYLIVDSIGRDFIVRHEQIHGKLGIKLCQGAAKYFQYIGRGIRSQPEVAPLIMDDTAESVDNINNPKHYNSHPSGVECIQITEHMNFNCGNAVKYLWRTEHKNGLEDLKKARWYIDREIERLEKE